MAENTFDRFSVFFTGDTVFLDGTVFPLGQLATDVLNLDSKVLTEIDRRVKVNNKQRAVHTVSISPYGLPLFLFEEGVRNWIF